MAHMVMPFGRKAGPKRHRHVTQALIHFLYPANVTGRPKG